MQDIGRDDIVAIQLVRRELLSQDAQTRKDALAGLLVHADQDDLIFRPGPPHQAAQVDAVSTSVCSLISAQRSVPQVPT